MVGRERLESFSKKKERKTRLSKTFSLLFHSFFYLGLERNGIYTPAFPAVLIYSWKKKKEQTIYNRAE